LLSGKVKISIFIAHEKGEARKNFFIFTPIPSIQESKIPKYHETQGNNTVKKPPLDMKKHRIEEGRGIKEREGNNNKFVDIRYFVSHKDILPYAYEKYKKSPNS
jgi:hypothetical protein